MTTATMASQNQLFVKIVGIVSNSITSPEKLFFRFDKFLVGQGNAFDD